MVTEQDLEEYAFESLMDYFQYINESYINGQIKQAKTLARRLDRDQYGLFIDWFMENAPDLKECIK